MHSAEQYKYLEPKFAHALLPLIKYLKTHFSHLSISTSTTKEEINPASTMSIISGYDRSTSSRISRGSEKQLKVPVSQTLIEQENEDDDDEEEENVKSPVREVYQPGMGSEKKKPRQGGAVQDVVEYV